MSRITCTCCGDEMELYREEGIAVCQSCGSMQMLPKEKDEERISLLNQADELRRKCSFEAAIALYSSIISKFPDEAVAYFRLALSEYGIEYVKDVDGKYIPTFHRMSYDSVLENPNIQRAIEKAGPIDMLGYQQQARELERVRQEILEKVHHAKPYDVFISFKQHTGAAGSTFTFDYDFGNRLYQDLTEEGYQVFFSPVTLQYVAGDAYEPAIFAALNSAKVMVLLSSCREYTDSEGGRNGLAVWVENEWTRFLELEKKDSSKKLIPCFYATPSTLPARLAGRQGVDMSRGSAAQKLLNQIGRILPRQKAQPASPSAQPAGGSGYGINENTLLDRVRQMLLDREFKEAASKCEQILDANSRCAEAYMSRALIARKECSLRTMKESLVQAVLDAPAKQYQVALPEQEMQQLMDTYEVSQYLTALEVRALLPEPEHYFSRYDAMEDCRDNVIDAFFQDKDVARAYSHAAGAYEQTLRSFKEEIYDEVNALIAQAQAKMEEDRQAAVAAIRTGKEQAVQKLTALCQEAKEQREADYQKACQVKTEEDVPEARQLLEKVGDYKDAPERKRDLDDIAETLEQIADGSDYLCVCLAREHPEALKEYVTNFVLSESKYTGPRSGWYWLIGLVICFFCGVDALFSGGGNWFGLLVVLAAFVVPMVFYPKKKFEWLKSAFTILFVAGNVLMLNLFSIAAAVCAFVTLRPTGVLSYFINKWNAKQDLKQKREGEFAEFERTVRQRLESQWQRILGTPFPHSLNSINGTLLYYEKKDITEWYLARKNEVRRLENRRKAPAAQKEVVTDTQTEVWIWSIPEHNKLKAIKAIRDCTGWGLAEAKVFVEKILAGEGKELQVREVEKAQELAVALQQIEASVTVKSVTKQEMVQSV